MDTSDSESKNLETHVAANRMRFEYISDNFKKVEERLEKIEQKVDTLQEKLTSSNSTMIKTIIYSSGTIVASLLSTIVVVILKL